MSKSGTPIKIYCLNLRCGYIREERDGRENMIRTRQHRVNKQIKRLDPDVIALQECTSGWLALLEDGILDDYTIVNKWRARIMIHDRDVESCPVAYKTAKYNELDRGWFWLSETPEVSSPAYEPEQGPRIVTWVKLQDKETKAEFVFASTHFPLGEGYANVMAGRQCARWFDEMPEGTNAFIMGDLNAPYRGFCYSGFAYEPGFKNVFDICKAMEADGKKVIGEVRPKGTFNQFKYPDGANFIDHIFIKPNPRVAVDYYTVLYEMVGVPERNIPEGYVSDHFATYTEVRIDTDEDNGKYIAYGPEAQDRLPEDREEWLTRNEWHDAHGL